MFPQKPPKLWQTKHGIKKRQRDFSPWEVTCLCFCACVCRGCPLLPHVVFCGDQSFGAPHKVTSGVCGVSLATVTAHHGNRLNTPFPSAAILCLQKFESFQNPQLTFSENRASSKGKPQRRGRISLSLLSPETSFGFQVCCLSERDVLVVSIYLWHSNTVEPEEATERQSQLDVVSQGCADDSNNTYNIRLF